MSPMSTTWRVESHARVLRSRSHSGSLDASPRAPTFDRFPRSCACPLRGSASRPKTAPRSSPGSTKRSTTRPAHARSDRPRARRRVRQRATRREHAVAVSSGTSALEIILRALDVEGREVHRPGEHVLRDGRGRGARRRARRVRRLRSRDDGVRPRRRRGRSIGPDTAAVVVVHIGGLISPARPDARARCATSAACTSSRTPRTRTAARSAARSAGTFGVAGAFSLLPDQGHRRRRGRHDRHRRRRASPTRRGSTATRARARSSPTSTPASARTGA